MKKRNVLTISFLFFLFICAYAVPSKALVLDFYDNVAAPPGFYSLFYFNYVDQPRLVDNAGKNTQGGPAGNQNYDLSAEIAILRPVYYFKGLGMLWAFNAIIPYGKVQARDLATGDKESSTGLGDINIGPAVFLYQNDKTMTYVSFWEFVSLPTGDYSKDRAMASGANMGYNHVYLEHELAFSTSFVENSKVSYDMNINYFTHFNGPDIHPADVLECEGILGYGITNNLRAGIYATYWAELEKAKMFGVEYDKRTFFSVGPSIAYSKEKWGVNFRWVEDVMAKNGPEGRQFFLRFNYSF